MNENARRAFGMAVSAIFATAAVIQLVQLVDELTDGQVAARTKAAWARMRAGWDLERRVAREAPFVYWEAVEALEEGSHE